MTKPEPSDDEKDLGSLGYKQDLNRSWSGFSNFAIPCWIISFLVLIPLFSCWQLPVKKWSTGPISAVDTADMVR